MCFPNKFAKFLRTPILKNIFERLLLLINRENLYLFEHENKDCKKQRLMILISNGKMQLFSYDITFVKIKGFFWHGTESDTTIKLI